MDYAAQEGYFRRSHIWCAVCAGAVISAAVLCIYVAWPFSGLPGWIGFALVVAAIIVSACYTPDYLYLTVNPHKQKRWAVRVRWRIAFAIPIAAALISRELDVIEAALLAGIWVALTNGVARYLGHRLLVAVYLVSDLVLLIGLATFRQLDILVLVACIAAATHFFALLCRAPFLQWAVLSFLAALVWVVTALFGSLQMRSPFRAGVPSAGEVAFSAMALTTAAGIGSILLVSRSAGRQQWNSAAAMNEINVFTGYPAERIRELWSTADQQLARNWQTSGVAKKSPEEIAEWYRQNSELYMFAISAYNLEYKRIKSNLKMLSYARGACLDYGAGNGELILELARRGHRAAYYDVDGVSKRFAQFRALKYGLHVEFASTKDELCAIGSGAAFDTIFSFDVLEHIPDLAGELDFLISLLNPNGLLLFDVPAGATVNHPMHLNHTLNVREHLLAKGMKEVPMRSWRLGKQEKYAFVKTSRTK